jgi:hypothetical protein
MKSLIINTEGKMDLLLVISKLREEENMRTDRMEIMSGEEWLKVGTSCRLFVS